jgi:hypothetical protein
MALPDATLSILDGQLASLPPSIANSMVSLGICSAGIPNTLYSVASSSVAQSQMGQGPLVEAVVDALSVAGGPALAMPLNPTTAGAVGSVTHSPALGAGTVTPSRAPAVSIAVKVTTGGALGTAAIAISLAGGGYGAPVVSVTGSTWAYLVPGTNTTITLTAATYVLNDVYTVATTGVVTVVGTGPSSNVTQVSSPLDIYDVQVTITTSGALGAAIFIYSVDGGTNVSAQILVPSGGVYVIPGTGVVLTFASTFVALDVYEFTTTTASFSNTDVTNAYTALLGAPIEWSLSHVIGMGANAAAAASLAAAVEAQMVLAMAGFRYVHSVIECPQSESDATIATAFSNFVSAFGRTSVVCGDAMVQSTISGRTIRRNLGTPYASRLAAIRPAESPARQKTGAIQNVTKIFRDERKTPFLDANRFVTAGQEVGVAGFFFVSGNTMAAGGSDYAEIMNGRVMDMSCRIVRSAALTYLNDDVTVDPKTGGIYDPVAEAIESFINGELKAGVINTNNASPLGQGNSMVAVDRTNPILTDKTIKITVQILPKGYGKFISITIGFTNPAAGG